MKTGVVLHEEVDRDQEALEEDLEVQEGDTGIPSSVFMISVKCSLSNNPYIKYILSYFMP